MYKKAKNYAIKNKYWVIGLILVIIGGLYYTYTKMSDTSTETKYVFSEAKKGILVSSVSGSGQVNPVNEIELKPKASGDIIYLNAIAGTKVKKGQIVAKLDTTDVSTNVRDANANLENAKISYAKYVSQNSDDKLNYNLTKAYDTGYSNVTDALADIPTLLNNLEDLKNKEVLSESTARITGGSKALDLRNKAESKYYQTETSVKALTKTYSGLDRKSSNDLINQSIAEAYKTSKLMSDLIKLEKDYVDYMYEESGRSAVYSQLQTSLSTYQTTINSHLNSLLSSVTSIDDATSAFGDTALGAKSSSLSVVEKQNALKDAQNKYEDYIVRAPFDGLIASSDVSVGDSASQSTVIAKLITEKKVAEISLNEVDVAQVKIGQKATLTFDAISNLTISGTVAEVDLVGTVSQGVVTYKVKVAFDVDDERVKPGMTANASIITNQKNDVLLVSNSAVKKQNGNSYVEVSADSTLLINTASTTKGILLPQGTTKKMVEVGLSNDEYTEIVSGLSEGDKIITRTISSSSSSNSSKTTTSSSNKGTNQVRMPGVPGL